MRIFFDTEFSGLTSDPRLLSIGLVSDSGEALYIEFTNGWSETDCSFWVQEHIMLMLGNGERLTRREAGARIKSWLALFDPRPTLLGETDWDTTLFADLMQECGIASDLFRLETLSYLGKAQANAFTAEKQRYFDSHQAIPHHALTDAYAFRDAWHRTFDCDPAPDR